MIEFEITTPERVAYKTRAQSVTLPTTQGEITVLPNHIPLVAMIKSGMITVRDEKNHEEYLAVSGGFIEIQPIPVSKHGKEKSENANTTRVIVLADTAERSNELTLEAVEAARERAAKALLEKRHIDEESFGLAAAALERELARLRVVHKHRSRHHP